MGYQNFSGYRIDLDKSLPVGTKYNQTAFHRSFNKASNFIRFGNITMEYYSDAWLQNIIHNGISKEATYDYNFKNKFNVSGGWQK